MFLFGCTKAYQHDVGLSMMNGFNEVPAFRAPSWDGTVV